MLDPWQAWVLDEALGQRGDLKWSAGTVCLLVPRQNGKGSVLEARALAGLLLFGERLITWSAHEFKTAQEAFRRMQELIESPAIDLRVKRVLTGNGTETIEFRNRQRLRFIARSQSSGRGFTGDCTILDEAYELSEKSIAAMIPALAARPNPQVWYTSSAPMTTSTVLHGVRNRGVTGEDAERLAFFEWAASNPDCDLDDWDQIAEANPSLGIPGHGITREFIETIERPNLTPEDFRRERFGIADPEPGQVEAALDIEAWHACENRRATIKDVAAIGVDVDPNQTRCAVAMAGVPQSGIVPVEIPDDGYGPMGAWLVPRILELHGKYGGAVVLESGGGARAILPDLVAAGVPLVLMSAADRYGACARFGNLVAERKLHHFGQTVLNVPVSQARRQRVGDAFKWDRRPGVQTDLTPLYAVTLACWPQQSEPAKSIASF